VSERTRRFFWGNSLAQAVMSAARYHRIDPESLAYRIHEKRHGFVKHPRAIVIEVDPHQPRRVGDAPAAPAAPAPLPTPRAAAPRAASPRPPRPAPAPGSAPPPREERRSREARPAPTEAWDAPDAESEVAAAEAGRRLLQVAGLELELAIHTLEDRLEVALSGTDEPRVAARGIAFLEELEHLLPRAIHGLSGRMVRCRVDCGGLREAHDEVLRELARREADRAVASGEPVLLEPLSSAERRVVHLELLARGGVTTESLGTGARKRVRISPV
jgi:spoIIIJ-associated protein